MKSMKKLLSLVLALCMVMGLATTAFADEAEYIDLELVYDDEGVNATAEFEQNAGETKLYQAYLNGDLVFTMEAENVTVVYKGKTYTPVAGVITFAVSGTRWEPCKFEIGNSASETAAYTIEFSYPKGSNMNPDTLVIGENTAEIAAGDADGYIYSWTADQDGELSILMTGESGWTYSFSNQTAGVYGATRTSADVPTLVSQTLHVTKGDELQVMVNTFDPEDQWNNPAGDVSFTVSKTSPAAKFTDLQEGTFYADAMDFMVGNGFMNGTSDTKMSPDTQTNRAMMATLLYRFAGKPGVEGKPNPFEDVPVGTYYTDAVIWAANNEIVNGMSPDSFAPTNTLTREQLVTMLWRYAGKPAGDAEVMEAFQDAATVSPFAKEAMAWAVGEKIINGMTATQIAPQGNATRAQFATMLYRYLAD